MSRGRLVALGLVLLAVLGAAALRVSAGLSRTTSSVASTGQVAPVDLTALRRTAALAACPKGLGPAFPDVVLPCLGGGPGVRLSAAGTGVPTLVNVYGSWCTPCADEMPTLVGFVARAGRRVALVGVDTEDDPRQALPFAREFGQHWPTVVDDDKVVVRAYAAGPPVTLFVDAAGTVVYVQRGGFSSVAQLAAAVALHLGVRV